ncbi:FMN-binding protein [Paenibacillus sp. 1P07SE]|uniref:FMN-binding protein n=1 Tax=Paenibacillus sp. 1P07SE TaxID=3132209 RepID=UPI0039A409CA
MKKMWNSMLILSLMIALMSGCGGNNAGNGPENTPPADPAPPATTAPDAEGELADGLYYAEGEYAEKSGWKEVVALEVQDGNITSVHWNGLHRDGGLDKRTASASGAYGMVAHGGAAAEWHEQAAKAEQFVIQQQNAQSLQPGEDGKTDAVSGVSIGVGEFSALIDQALAAGPVEPGPYKDGTYLAEAAEFDAKSGWKESVTLTVIGGKIAAVRWNGTHRDGGTDKVTRSKDGEYGMVAKGGAQAEWHEQAHIAEQYLLEQQDPAAIVYRAEDGKTDAISGVSIHVDGFVQLADEALAGAR